MRIISKKIQKLWKNRDISIICGEGIFDNIEVNIFDCASSIDYQYAPNHNAFKDYDKILNQALTIDKNRLIIIILGPTASVLACDLTVQGYQALDLGHIAKDYNSFVLNSNKDKKELKKFFAPD
ncbi:GT-D fold domain-containing glycosyltransferase [Lentisphaerota bacterium WC36G]